MIELNIKRQENINKFVEQQKYRKGQLDKKNDNFGLTRNKIEDQLSQGKTPSALLEYLLPQKVNADLLQKTKE